MERETGFEAATNGSEAWPLESYNLFICSCLHPNSIWAGDLSGHLKDAEAVFAA